MTRDELQRAMLTELGPADLVATFVDADVLGVAFKAEAFTPLDRTRRLVQLCNSPDEKVAISALKEVRTMVREHLELSGGINNRRTSVRQGPVTIEQVSRTATRVVSNIRKELTPNDSARPIVLGPSQNDHAPAARPAPAGDEQGGGVPPAVDPHG